MSPFASHPECVEGRWKSRQLQCDCLPPLRRYLNTRTPFLSYYGKSNEGGTAMANENSIVHGRVCQAAALSSLDRFV